MFLLDKICDLNICRHIHFSYLSIFEVCFQIQLNNLHSASNNVFNVWGAQGNLGCMLHCNCEGGLRRSLPIQIQPNWRFSRDTICLLCQTHLSGQERWNVTLSEKLWEYFFNKSNLRYYKVVKSKLWDLVMVILFFSHCHIMF